MFGFAAALMWYVVIIPSNSHGLVEASTAYVSQAECWSAVDAQVKAYVDANGGAVTKTRGYCVSK